MAWKRFMDNVQGLPPDQLDSLVDALCGENSVDPKWGKQIRKRLERAKAEDKLVPELVLMALTIGKITACVLRPATDTGFKLLRTAWSAAGSLHDIQSSINKGFFMLRRHQHAEQTPEWEVTNRPLYVIEEEANQFLKIRPPARARLVEVGKVIVSEWRSVRQERPMERKEFMRRLKAETKCSANEARPIWGGKEGHVVPEHWHRPGRRRKE
jgi:hypothetical protein